MKNKTGIAMFQPDIPQNVGAMMRLCSCLDLPLSIIEPCGFPWDERKIKRVAMDYMEHLELKRYDSWEDFLSKTKGQRKILLSTKAAVPYVNFEYMPGDILLTGRESAGAPDFVHEQVDAAVFIPMNPAARSLNVVNAAAVIVGESLRQIKSFG